MTTTARAPGERIVVADGIRWRCVASDAGPGAPRLLLIHGTGSSARSWTRFTAQLASRCSIVAPDLPGHGGRSGTDLLRGRAATLGAFADALAALLDEIGYRPDLVIGHSAGAAIAARLGLSSTARAEAPAIVGLNAALLPLAGWAGASYTVLARLCALNPLIAPIVSWGATDRGAIRRLLAGTGSAVDDDAVEHYRGLLREPAHVAGTLRMLAQWDLHGDLRSLAARLPSLGSRLTLVAATGDRTVAAESSVRIHADVPGSRLVTLDGLGHLAHEEAPATVARIIDSLVAERPR